MQRHRCEKNLVEGRRRIRHLGGDSIDIENLGLETAQNWAQYRDAFWDASQYGAQFHAQFRAQNVY